MLDLVAGSDPPPASSTLGPRTETEPPLGQVGHVVLYRCDVCPYETRELGDGRCPCSVLTSGVEVDCTGTLVTVPLWCAGCQACVDALAVTGDATGPLCFDCADEHMERTQRIPPFISEIARLLAPYPPEQIDEAAVLEAIATYVLDIGEYEFIHRFMMCAVGVALGFVGREQPAWMNNWKTPSMEGGYRAGIDIRTVYDAMREV